MDIDFEYEQTTEHIDTWPDKLLDSFLLDPRNHTAWKFWRASHPVNMGDSLRFSVQGSKHQGYVTIHYGGGYDPNHSEYGYFNIEFGTCEGTQYQQQKLIESVHRRDLVRTISLEVL